MANPEHLAILKRGVKEWNAWRKENDVEPDLVEADLSGADLIRAHLSGAHLSGADLRKADLVEADLSGAKLGEANFTEANLMHVSGARFDSTLLTRTRFSRRVVPLRPLRSWLKRASSFPLWPALRQSYTGVRYAAICFFSWRSSPRMPRARRCGSP